jgi:hypothetical protein
MKTRISSVALIETVSYCFFYFWKNTIDREESRRDVSEKDNCAASKKELIFRKEYKKNPKK